jgi:hypothetical protein
MFYSSTNHILLCFIICNLIYKIYDSNNYWYIILDINELNLPKTCGTEFPDPDDLLTFKLIICPDEVSSLFNVIY